MNKEHLMGSTYTDEDSVRDGYPEFEATVSSFFTQSIKGNKKLFKTNVEDLYDIYLSNLPEKARQHYTCHACEHFFNRFGNLVTIEEDGTMHSVMWDTENTPKFFIPAVAAIQKAVLGSKVIGVFVSDSQELGQALTGGWSHLSVRIPASMLNRDRLLTAEQVMAKKQENFKVLNNALTSFSLDIINQAVVLINSETLYGSDRVIHTANLVKTLKEKLSRINDSTKKRNITWLAVANATHVFSRSSMFGTLLKDIEDNLPTDEIVSRFETKMRLYMRSQSAPSSKAIYEAERIVEKLGIGDSLQRRYAQYEEIPTFLWKNKGKTSSSTQQKTGGVFGHLTPKNSSPRNVMNVPSTVMTWEKFKRTVLPTAESMEVLVDNESRLMALVTALYPESQNILQWDNTFSWYYHGGIDGEIKRRVEEAGGRYENNEIRVSLIWEGLTDLDLHCINPHDEHIMYSQKKDSNGGWLDLDMNGLDKNSAKPVENMRWASNAPEGRYEFYVHNYDERVNGIHGTPFRAELEIGEEVYHYNGAPLKNDSKITVFKFDYKKRQTPQFTNQPHSRSVDNDWGVAANSFVKVNGITTSPNLWGENPKPASGTHVFFLLDGVKDGAEGKGRGFFNETLKPELRPIRKTLEEFTAQTPIEGSESATACGAGYSKDNEWNLTVKVTTNNSTRLIKIDRWD